MKRYLRISILLSVLAACMAVALPGSAQKLNDKLMNRPYADLRRWHLGFSVGVHTQDLSFAHNGFVTPNGQTWFAEQPSFSPGFCVNGLVDLRLNDYFSLRISPGMYFGNREIKFHDPVLDKTETQNLKSAFVVLPVDVKYAAQRFRNVRPYMVAGVMPAFDVNKKKSSELLRLKTTDAYLSIGFGCDFYLPYFKLNPEIKFCFGLTDVIEHNRPDLTDDPDRMQFTQSLRRATSKMFVLTFYFE